MKIYAYEVRSDEIEYLQRFAAASNAEFVCSSDVLRPEDIETLDEGSAVTMLGMQNYGKAEMEAFKKRNIRYISTRTIGYNHLDIDAAKACGIHICNARYAPNGVADYTIMMILLCLRNYKQVLWRLQVNDFTLQGLMGREMKDLTIGIIGTGRIGAQVIKNLSGFGSKILCYDRHTNEEVAKYAEYRDIETIYRQCDVISVHVALTPDTYHMINKSTISRMKDGVILINCARGALMDINALIDGIESQKIGALGIDTIEEEEGIVHRDLRTDIFSDRNIAYIRQFKNVTYSYHMAFYTDAAVKSMAECGINGIVQMAEGKECATQLC